MNIREAKHEIKNALCAYLARDEFGNHLIPIDRQRPVFLLGAPGIGKTAIIQQIADELGVGLVSYSMTHHTRQSALGLPFIEKKEFGGQEYTISEYTMSEIIASVYLEMENGGHSEGILFLDEINCVSETLTPAMLQFLQFKTFGRHRVPDGWIVVTAGNPPEYNNSVREFDIVTWDRLKRIDIEPDFSAWKEYAYHTGIHPSIISYLELKTSDFYKVETTVDGKRFVTARGWDDLSQMVQIYEQQEIEVNEQLIIQYLQDRKIAKDYSIYYDLFKKYREEYRVEDILAGNDSNSLKERVRQAPFDERISLIGLLINGINNSMRATMTNDAYIEHLHGLLKEEGLRELEPIALKDKFHDIYQREQNTLTTGHITGTLSKDKQLILGKTLGFFETLFEEALHESGSSYTFAAVDSLFKNEVAVLTLEVEATKNQLNNMFLFIEEVFGAGQEILLVVTELSISSAGMRFISEYGCDKYFEHNKGLLFHERHKDLEIKLTNLSQTQYQAESETHVDLKKEKALVSQ